MLHIIKEELKRWDYRRQQIGENPVPNIIARIEQGYYKLKHFDLNIDVYNLGADSFDCPDLFEFMVHYKLVQKAKLKYPVILNDKGQVIDGRHRIVKAILKGHKTIKAIQILDDTII